MLRNIKNMASLMNRAADGDAKWKEMHKKIKSINPDDPKACTEEKVQEIFDAVVGYMKGKKSLRKTPEERKMFNQALDVLVEFKDASPYAGANVQAVFDRINEVRRSHDSEHKDLQVKDYGLAKIEKHTDQSYVPAKKFKEKYKLTEAKESRKVFEPLPKGDVNVLPDWNSQTMDRPIRVKTEFKHLENFTTLYERDEEDQLDLSKPRKLKEDDAIEGIARIMALSESPMYNLSAKRVGLYYADRYRGVNVEPEIRYNGSKARIEGSLAVISRADYEKRLSKYLLDPVVKEMAKKYTSAEEREKLFKQGNKHIKNVNMKEGKIRNPKNQEENIVLDKNALPGKPILESPDPAKINIGLIKAEYETTKAKLEPKPRKL